MAALRPMSDWLSTADMAVADLVAEFMDKSPQPGSHHPKDDD